MFDENTHTCVYNDGDLLAVTIAPDDTMQQYRKPKRYNEFVTFYSTKLNRLFGESKLFDYWFRIEASEPIGQVQTDGPRLHLHGMVKLKKPLSVHKWLVDIMPDLLQHSRMEIRHIKDKECRDGWIAYCNKQRRFMPLTNDIGNIDSDLMATSEAAPQAEL